MIDGVIGVCTACGEELEALRNIELVHRAGATTIVEWRCKECGFMGRLSYGRDWFKAQIAPAIRWAARKAGARPATDDEKLLRGFVVDLEAVDSVADLDLYWRAQPVTTVPREARRG